MPTNLNPRSQRSTYLISAAKSFAESNRILANKIHGIRFSTFHLKRKNLLKFFLLFCLTSISICGFTQQTIYWRSGTARGNWWDSENPWYRTCDGYHVQVPDDNQCNSYNTTFGRNWVNIDNNSQVLMTVNGKTFNLKSLTFKSGASNSRTFNAAAGGTINVDAGFSNEDASVNTHTFNVSLALGGSCTFNANNGTFTFTSTFLLNTYTATFSGNNSISGIISESGGPGSIVKSNSGTLTLSGANTYTGSTTVSGGTLRLNRSGGTTIPSGNSATVNNGGTLQISTNQTVNDLTVASGGTVTIEADVTLTITGTLSNNGTISGSGKLAMGGNSAQTISGTGTISNLAINNSAGVTITAGAGNMQSLTGTLTPTAGTLTTNGNLTLKSNASTTARVGEGSSSGGYISGDVTVERYFETNRRAWRMITAPVMGSSNNSIYYNWQNNGSVIPGTGVEIWGPDGTGSAGNGSSTTGLVNGPYASMRYWNNSTGAFENITDTKLIDAPTPLFNSSGNPLSFFLFASGDYGSGNIASGIPGSNRITLKAIGSLRQGNQSFSITGATAGIYYMVGNPYACPVDLGSAGVNMNNVDDAIYLWDPNLNTSGTSGTGTTGGYVTFTRTSNTYNNNSGAYSNGANYTRLQSGQAFFVRATAAANLSVAFTESNKGGLTVSQVFRNTNELVTEKMRLTLQRNSGNDYITTDGAVAFFYSEGEKEVNRMDGQKLMNNANNVMFRRDGASLTFEYRPTIQENDTLFLRLQSTSAGNYRLITEASDFTSSSHLQATLEDTYLGKEQPLSLEAAVPYDFAVDGNTASSADRFRIVFKSKTMTPPIDNDPKSSIGLYPNPIKAGESLNLDLRKREAGKYTIAIYNLMGVQVQQQVVLHAGSSAVQNIKLNSNLPAGTYLINVLDASSRKVEAVKINVQ
ncbi:MAG: T9SS type A sorting domain-containing protein [Bacteroidetes bacterium]|nr:T9SS type A sorting domain-containing protein [Bacteroidota bacterium]